jgi:hypothetical protein
VFELVGTVLVGDGATWERIVSVSVSHAEEVGSRDVYVYEPSWTLP